MASEDKGLAQRPLDYHPVAMPIRPICEPVELPPGASVIAERVTIPAHAPATGRFMHFHDVAELVLFRRVRGEFVAGGRRHALSDGAIIFVPSMHHHDFALEGGSMEWVLVQLDPYVAQALARRPAFARLRRPFHARPDAAVRARLDVLADWLLAAVHRDGDESVERLVELLLLAAAEAPEAEIGLEDEGRTHVERTLPVLERLRAAPAERITVDDAASMCGLSPAYFSRRFRHALGMNFSQYVRTYRLHLGARRLAAGGASISEIAYGLGFSSPSHFTARFRERFGMSPREYRSNTRRRVD